MTYPKRVEDITLNDLQSHRWCYLHDDEQKFDSFEWLIPDTHPRFSTDVIEMELAIFRFKDGQEFIGRFDGSAQFSVSLAGKWHSFWTGIMRPAEEEKEALAHVMSRLSLEFPVEATAKWSGAFERFNGIRYVDHEGQTLEV